MENLVNSISNDIVLNEIGSIELACKYLFDIKQILGVILFVVTSILLYLFISHLLKLGKNRG